MKAPTTHRQPEASPGAVAVLSGLVQQRLDQRRHANYRVLLRVNRRFEAYFRPPAGPLPFIAVMPPRTAKRKIEQIEFYGDSAILAERRRNLLGSGALAREPNGHYIDQFTFAERATGLARSNNNIADSIFPPDEP